MAQTDKINPATEHHSSHSAISLPLPGNELHAIDLDKSLIVFRTAWMQAIALAWSDPGFLNSLIKSPDAMEVIAERFPRLKESTLYSAFTLRVFQEQSFVWIGDDWAWTGQPGGSQQAAERETLVIRVPLCGPLKTGAHGADPEAQNAIALAALYAMRPAIFTPVQGPTGGLPRAEPHKASGADLRLPGPHKSMPLKTFHVTPTPGGLGPRPAIFSDLTATNDELMVGAITFLEFQVAVMSMVAKAWANENFRNLLQDSTNFIAMMVYVRGFNVPWQLKLRMAHDEAAKWDSAKHVWTNLSKHQLALALPERPPLQRDCAVALAAYNATGSRHPFTCC